MIEVAILKNYDSQYHRAGVQLAGSLTTCLDDIPVSVAVPASALVIGNRVILATPGGNPKDAVVIATWPQGGGSLLALSDTPSSYSGQAGKYLKVNDAQNAIEFVPPIAKQSGAHAYMGGTSQTIPNATDTLVELSAVSYDFNSEFNTGTYRFTLKQAGLYMIAASIQWPAPIAAKRYATIIRKNGGHLRFFSYHAGATTITLHTLGFALADLAVNDYIELAARHDAGSSTTIVGDNFYAKTHLTIARLG